MKKVFPIITIVLSCMDSSAQNVGIGTTTPGFPLNFANTPGDKISLYGNTGNHYGFGIQGGLLQIHTDLATSNIAFGHGSSGSFNERMRILNNTGYDGMSLNGRLILKNGSADLVGGGAGVWLYKADNSNLLGFMGTQNNQNIGFFGGPGGWGFTYDAINSRVGIGNNNPNAPLAFPPLLGKKITLYPGATGDAGFGMAGNRLQIYADNPNADVAIGYDAAGIFNERFAVKPNGALAISGNTGTAGEVLTSNGNSNPAEWGSPTKVIYNSTMKIDCSDEVLILAGSPVDIPGLTYTFTTTSNAKVIVNFNIPVSVPSCALCGWSKVSIQVNLNNTNKSVNRSLSPNDEYFTMSGSALLQLSPGTHTIKLVGHVEGPSARFGVTSSYIYHNEMILQIIPE